MVIKVYIFYGTLIARNKLTIATLNLANTESHKFAVLCNKITLLRFIRNLYHIIFDVF